MANDVLVLGIETSCDDTGAGIVLNGKKVLSNVVASQIKIHEKYGGVVPELASRNHLENVYYVIDKALKEAGVTLDMISAVAVTYGPGLVGSLLVGIETAKAIAFAKKIPLIGVNHLEAHLFAAFLEHEVKFPFLTLIISGGHTELVVVKEFGNYEVTGETRDDACGEAFDKVAKLLELGYPGGPKVEEMAKTGKKSFKFPKAVMKDGSSDFSFSGLKTAVLTHFKANKNMAKEDLCASFQNTVIETLLDNTLKTAVERNITEIVLGGGVVANKTLRESFKVKCEKEGFNVYFPGFNLCTDNGAMIAYVGYQKFLRKQFSGLDLNADPGLAIT
ncbi:MAG: tRNA (adenosine(37)-N6)-threonylcarbamoyltransferase complex transferase subunit TsaD [Candidatus Firestonebacteria bacterium]